MTIAADGTNHTTRCAGRRPWAWRSFVAEVNSESFANHASYGAERASTRSEADQKDAAAIEKRAQTDAEAGAVVRMRDDTLREEAPAESMDVPLLPSACPGAALVEAVSAESVSPKAAETVVQTCEETLAPSRPSSGGGIHLEPSKGTVEAEPDVFRRASVKIQSVHRGKRDRKAVQKLRQQKEHDRDEEVLPACSFEKIPECSARSGQCFSLTAPEEIENST